MITDLNNKLAFKLYNKIIYLEKKLKKRYL